MAVTIWVIDSLSRTRKTSAPGASQTITLRGARREAQSFQISILSTTNTTQAVTVWDADGLTVEMFVERWVNLTTGSAQSSYYQNKGEGPGWWPDGLTPLASGASVTLTANSNESVWVDVTIPIGATAGTHNLSIQVGTTVLTIPVVVWNFALPERPKMGSLFMYRTSAVRSNVTANALLRKHRVLPMYQTVADSANQDWVSVSFYTSVDGACNNALAPPTPAAVAAKKLPYEPIPAGTTLYSYTMDEIWYCVGDADLKNVASACAEALHLSDIKVLITLAPDPEWPFVDISVVLPKFYDKDKTEAAIRAGRKAWSYTCLNQDSYSPKWLLDMKPLNYRIYGWINEATGMSGLLYWSCDYWTTTPWTNVEKSAAYRPGEGMLVYPATGTPYGDFPGVVLPSMRLKQIRDAVQDWELAELAKEAGFVSEAAAIVATVATDFAWGYWTQDKDVILAAHRALGELMDEPSWTPPPLDGAAALTCEATMVATATLSHSAAATLEAEASLVADATVTHAAAPTIDRTPLRGDGYS